jgi:ATP-dependent Clp protease ATP-binding subunit ClpX
MMERATVCFDEIDKISRSSAASRTSPASRSSRTLLTLIEGEKVLVPDHRDRRTRCPSACRSRSTPARCSSSAPAPSRVSTIQVYKRVTSPATRVKLPTETVLDNGKVSIREVFALRHHFKPEDLFEYGMQPQFLSRFDNAIILEDLGPASLMRIFLEPAEGVFRFVAGLLPEDRHRPRSHRRRGEEDRRRGREEQPHRRPRVEGRFSGG